jgi:NAD(P)-dependent dehydrogenase (short-subunit alcohol dehydrogenase family)
MANTKTWFITGASRGFGLDITSAALSAGDQVIATVRSKPEDLARQFNNNPRLFIVTMDVTNEPQIARAVQSGIDHFKQIDILVNNAGYGLLSGIEEATNEEIKANYEVNVFGTLNMIRAVLPYMRKQQSGHIINISSVGGLSGNYPGWGLYASTKFAIEGITEALALETAPLGIKATVVAPGFFRTNFLDKSSLSSSAQIIPDYEATVGAMRNAAPQISYNQPGDPKKLAAAFVRLANAENPPVHLLLGNDTLAMYRAKTAALETDIQNWYDTVTGTDHDDVAKKN